MKIHLIDSDGYHAYSGNEINPKVARLEQEGYVRVPTAVPDTVIRQKWVSDSWQDDPVILDYVKLRRGAYASWGDQLDMQYHDLLDDTTIWRDHIAAVKAAHPKP
jgi:hypothetical protein